MSRQLKFRVWDMVTVKMVVWEDLLNKHDLNEIFKYGYDLELMQYTGLKDKNGVEIYEGDILEGFSVYPTKDTFQSKTLGDVYYSNRGTWDCCSFLLGGINEQMEVIGNIYDNPELIGGKNEV